MYKMGDDSDMLASLKWDKEIKRYSDDYEMPPFSQSIQARRWMIEEER